MLLININILIMDYCLYNFSINIVFKLKIEKKYLKSIELMQICQYSHIHSPATLLGTPVQLLVTQIANQPIAWQQLNAFRHLDVVKTTC